MNSPLPSRENTGDASHQCADAHALSPLLFFHDEAASKLIINDFKVIKPKEMPQPYRDLLFHKGDMTPTLERFHKCDLTLLVLNCLKTHDGGEHNLLSLLRRQVVLQCTGAGKAVEFGAIEIFADKFPDWAREQIEACQTPLGTILGQWERRSRKMDKPLGHHSIPSSFFSVVADQSMSKKLQTEPGTILWGRTNKLLTSNMILLANVVEILAPAGLDRNNCQ